MSILSRVHFPSCLQQLLEPGLAKGTGADLHLGAAAGGGTWKRIPPPCTAAGNSKFGHFTKPDTETYFLPPCPFSGLLGEGERPAGEWKSISPWMLCWPGTTTLYTTTLHGLHQQPRVKGRQGRRLFSPFLLCRCLITLKTGSC